MPTGLTAADIAEEIARLEYEVLDANLVMQLQKGSDDMPFHQDGVVITEEKLEDAVQDLVVAPVPAASSPPPSDKAEGKAVESEVVAADETPVVNPNAHLFAHLNKDKAPVAEIAPVEEKPMNPNAHLFAHLNKDKS